MFAFYQLHVIPFQILVRFVPELLWVSLLLFLSLSGCRSVPVGQSGEVASIWDSDQLEEHVSVLNSDEVEGRVTGTQGYARAAEYVAAQMALHGLQPAIQGDYRLMYPVPVNYVQFASLAIVGTDTLHFGLGVDFLADARSDSGTVVVRHIVRMRGNDVDQFRAETALMDHTSDDTAVLLPAGHVSDSVLVQLRDAGLRTVFLEGGLAPAQSSTRVPGILIVQVTSATAARIETELTARVSRPMFGGVQKSLKVRVISRHLPFSSAINVLGFLAGKHPTLSKELVIVCADLDAVGTVGGVQTLDLEQFGSGVAAMLEVARVQAMASLRLHVPDRTVLFAAWAGGRLGHAGLKAYLERPVWPLGATRAVIYVGLSAQEEDSLQELLASYGITLYAVSSPASLGEADVLLMPSSTQRRMASSETEEEDIDMSQTIERAALLAEQMAQEANDLLVQAAVMAAPAAPILESSLQVPASIEGN